MLKNGEKAEMIITTVVGPRTLDELRVANAENVFGRIIVAVNTEESILLLESGARIRATGLSREVTRRFQMYTFEGRRYIWVAGRCCGAWDDKWPVQPANPEHMNQLFGALASWSDG